MKCPQDHEKGCVVQYHDCLVSFILVWFGLSRLPMCHPFTLTLVRCLPLPVRRDAMRQVAGRGRKRHLSLQGTVPDQATSAQT